MSDKLETVMIPTKSVNVAKERLAPLHLMYWNSRGYMTVEEVMLNAYVQGFMDAIQVETRFPRFKTE